MPYDTNGAQWFLTPSCLPFPATGGVADQRHSLSHLRLGWPRNSPTYLEGWPVVSRLKRPVVSKHLSCWMNVFLERICSKLRHVWRFGLSGFRCLLIKFQLWFLVVEKDYLSAVDGIIFLVDAADRTRFQEAQLTKSWNGGNHVNPTPKDMDESKDGDGFALPFLRTRC